MIQEVESGGSFACDREISGRLAQLAGDGVVAQADYQRVKYFEDDLYVLDLNGLNSRRIAHLPDQDRVRWGKTDAEFAVSERPEVLQYGHRVGVLERANAAHPLGRVLTDPDLATEFIGYPLRAAVAEMVVEHYRAASLRVCDGYFNFLLRADVAAATTAPDLWIGGAATQDPKN